MGNHARFINYSCNANCIAKHYLVTDDGFQKVIIVATKDINKDEQLFLNYGKQCFSNMACRCNNKNCLEKQKIPKHRGVYNPKSP